MQMIAIRVMEIDLGDRHARDVDTVIGNPFPLQDCQKPRHIIGRNGEMFQLLVPSIGGGWVANPHQMHNGEPVAIQPGAREIEIRTRANRQSQNPTIEIDHALKLGGAQIDMVQTAQHGSEILLLIPEVKAACFP
jgi:hypothetical protein